VQPGAPRHGERAGLRAQVVGDHALDFGRALGQVGRDVGRQLGAQLKHGAGGVVEQFAVLVGRIDDVFARLRQPQRDQRGRRQQHHDHREHASPTAGAGAHGRNAQQAFFEQAGEPARDQKADAHADQARQ
jgi:hypothetical protein